jgi:hypothetical protein
MAQEALERIAKLYAIEAEAKALTILQRQVLRQEKAKPLLESLQNWLQDTLTKTAPGGASAKAIAYALKRWPAVSRYADTGHLPIGRVEMQRGGLSFSLSDPPLSFGGASLAKA